MTDRTIPGMRLDEALPRIEEALVSARAQARRYNDQFQETGWTCDQDSANYYEGREAALVYVLNLLTGYRGDR